MYSESANCVANWLLSSVPYSQNIAPASPRFVIWSALIPTGADFHKRGQTVPSPGRLYCQQQARRLSHTDWR
ncbi:hypothetical protein D0V40_03325 [Salmonella enterica]|nr:hypothetical protein [Salmonella enterica]